MVKEGGDTPSFSDIGDVSGIAGVLAYPLPPAPAVGAHRFGSVDACLDRSARVSHMVYACSAVMALGSPGADYARFRCHPMHKGIYRPYDVRQGEEKKED